MNTTEQVSFNFNKPLLLDTNVLILYLVGLFDKKSISNIKILSHYSDMDFELLKASIDKFRKIVITPHILSELTNLLVNRPKTSNRKVSNFLQSFVNNVYKFKELSLHKNEILKLEYFSRVGTTDSAIIELARKNGLNVITDDTGLYVILSYYRIPVLNINHIRGF